MGKSIIEPLFGPNAGIKLDFPEQFLKNQISPYSRNMEYYNGLLRSRLGKDKFDTTALSGPVLLIDQFWRFDTTWDLVVCTNKDIYKYDFGNTRFDILTPYISTGTITIAAGSETTVTGSGTNWATSLNVGDFIKIGTGNLHTDAVWLEIGTCNSNTQLTLLTASAVTCADAQYIARQIFTGNSGDHFWQAVTFQDSNMGETWIATNGLDLPVYYVTTGPVTNLTVPTGLTAARFINIYKDRLIFLWTVEGGGNQPQRVRASEVADCLDWDDLVFWDFIEDQAWITGSMEFGDYFVVMRERGARVGRYIGGDDIFDFEMSTVPVGCNAANSIVAAQDSIFYYGIDNKFHQWNVLREDDISEEIFPFTREFDPNLEGEIFGWQIEGRNQIRWFVPYTDTDYMNYEIVWDYKEGVIQIWDCALTQALKCIGEYLNVADLYVDDTVWGEYFCDEQEGFWDDRIFLEGAPIILYGGSDGYIRKADIGTQDDSSDYNRIFRTKRLDFKRPHLNKRLWKQEWWFEAQTTGNVSIFLKKDDKNDFEALVKTISQAETERDIIKKQITWDKEAQSFQFQVTSTEHYAILGILNYLFEKGGDV